MLVSANTQTAAASTTEAAVQTQCGASLHEAPVAASVNVVPVPQLPAGFWPLGGSTPVRMDESLPAEEETPAAEVDTTYLPSFRESFFSTHQDDSAGVLTGVEEPLHAERKFIVFESSLRELFANCSACGQALGNLNFSVVGTLVVVEGVCEQQHKLQWRSQPLVRASPAFHQLKTIVDNPLLLRDIRRLTPEVQTFSLESFHSVLNCFAPKSNAFSEDGMQARTWLAVLHFNENAGRQQALTREGEERWKMKSSKARRGHFTVAAVKEEPSYGM
ncbi:hypothetical protein MTO96_034490 [Rhipicephalus appendiculatus]